MKCPTCEQDVKPGTKFCMNCGTRMPEQPVVEDANKTLIASPMPPQSQLPPTQAIGQQAFPPNQAGQQPGYNQQPSYNQQQSPPQYGGQPNYPQGQMYGQAQHMPNQQQMYVPTDRTTPQSGRIPAILMLVTSGILVLALFLPFLSDRFDSFSLVGVLIEFFNNNVDTADLPAASFMILGYPILPVLTLAFSALAFFKRRQGAGIVNLLLGLVIGGFFGLMWLGFLIAESEGNLDFRAKIAIPLTAVAGLMLFLISIAYLVTKKQPR